MDEKTSTSGIELLKKGLQELGIKPQEELVNKFIFYLGEFKRWNRAYNISAHRKDQDIIQKDFLDSLLYLSLLGEDIYSVADVGSGGGFPGLVLKIVRPELLMHLIEPSRKKSAFLKHMVFKLNLKDVYIHQNRVEEISIQVDAALSRALFKIKDFIKRVSHIIRPGGRMILSKGPDFKKELEGLEDIQIQVFEKNLPTADIKRYLIVVKL